MHWARMLRDDIYDYLWKQIKNKSFVPGEFVDLNSIAKKLNVSRTPLREALIVLENEGFVKILPKKGIYVKPLTLYETYDLYEIIGALESAIVMNEWDKITPDLILQMDICNEKMAVCTEHSRHYELNREFHFLYIQLTKNTELTNYLVRLYRRIYDFSGINYGPQFQKNNISGHREFIRILQSGNRLESADYLRDAHWKFRVPEIFVNMQ